MARVARARVAVSDRAVGRDQRTCVKGPGLPNVGISRSDRWPLQPACLFTPRQVGGDRAHRALELARLQLLAQVEGGGAAGLDPHRQLAAVAVHRPVLAAGQRGGR